MRTGLLDVRSCSCRRSDWPAILCRWPVGLRDSPPAAVRRRSGSRQPSVGCVAGCSRCRRWAVDTVDQGSEQAAQHRAWSASSSAGSFSGTRHLVAGWASGVLRTRYLWSPVGHSRVGQASPCSAHRMSTIKAMQSSQANNAGVSPQTPHRLSGPQNEHFKSVSRVDEFMGHLGTRLGRLWRY